jgi:hypothetical protein
MFYYGFKLKFPSTALSMLKIQWVKLAGFQKDLKVF